MVRHIDPQVSHPTVVTRRPMNAPATDPEALAVREHSMRVVDGKGTVAVICSCSWVSGPQTTRTRAVAAWSGHHRRMLDLLREMEHRGRGLR